MIRFHAGRYMRRLAVVVTALALVAAACSETDSTKTDPGTTPVSSAVTTAAPISVEVAALQGGLVGYDIETVAWNGYWYSRYNLGSLVMKAGMGVPMEPPMEAVMAMVAAVDQGPEDGEHVMMPANAALIQAVFAGGDATFANASNGDPMDFSNARWSSFDNRLVASAQAQTILKELEWAKLFNSGAWAGTPTDQFGAQDRFMGMVLFAEAKAQAMFALANLQAPGGLFWAEARMVDGSIETDGVVADLADQFEMLTALADLRLVLTNADSFNGVYADPDYLAMIDVAVTDLFAALEDETPESVLGLGQAAQAMVWFAASESDPAARDRALERLGNFGDGLLAASPTDPVGEARTIRGLIEAGRVLDDARYTSQAADLFVSMMNGYDGATGSFNGVETLTTWEVGDIIGAFNSLRFNATDFVDRSSAEAALVGFFEATINIGGLLRAAPPKEMAASPFELARLTEDTYFAYPGMPMPPVAGGDNGAAPVDVAAIEFDPATGLWSQADTGYDTAGAMHASNEMFWVWGFQNGFPVVASTGSEPTSAAGDGVIEVVATEFGFEPAELNLTPGTEVTIRLRNDGAIAHNLDIPEYGVLIETSPGEAREFTFVVPESGAVEGFFCNIPGHREAGMEGAVSSG